MVFGGEERRDFYWSMQYCATTGAAGNILFAGRISILYLCVHKQQHKMTRPFTETVDEETPRSFV